jgi:alkanesulfonate monooxygenase SsuD/methylene tetrahydromethanopterin reductase-like flavin-dependent oxidoreductase (luciferase family)
MGEHVVLFDKNTFGYPGSKDGRIPVPEGGGMLDVTATFGFLAAATSRVRLGTGVALVPQRNPLYTAKEICTLDWLSGGRIERHRCRLEQGGGRGVRLSLGGPWRALR